jgi:RsiW-degrading membrane proteinase PrsW (M82 family)
LIAASAMLIGSLMGASTPANWLVLPILTLPAVVLPLAVLLALGTQGLPWGSRWGSWSALGLGMSLTPFLLLALETVVAVFAFVGVVAYVMTQPQLISELQALSERIMILGPQSQEEALDLLSPFLTRPGVMVMALLYMAIFVPALEELLKPLGVWLFAGRLESPAQGFTLGALSGAGYALIETIGVSGQVAEWASLLFTRIGTGLLHITTSALVGAAIVRAWRERRYLGFIGTYFLAVVLHGLWNAAALLFAFSTLADLLEQPGRLATFQPLVIVVMSVLAVGLFAILILSNRKMRKTIPLPPSEPVASGDAIDHLS